MKEAIFPGSFDPLTYGHVDIVERALKIFNHIVIGVAQNRAKSALFSLKERKEIIEATFKKESRITVEIFEGLLVDFAKKCHIPVIIRGLRNSSDFSYESNLAAMNRHMDKNFETIFFLSNLGAGSFSSSLIKEIAFLGGDVEKMVPKEVSAALKKRVKK